MRVIWDIFIGDVRNLFRNVIAAIVVMGLALVPPMYAWFTTLGFWDPYSNTGNIKVAVASEDAGYTSDLIPTPINAGEQIIGKLRANDQFAWQFVSADEAVHGVRSGEYYAALVIPKEFSRDLMTVFSDDITEPKIIYYDNEKENAIAQRVTATGASTLQETIDETFTETVASVALGTTSSLTSFMSGDGILTYAQTLGSRLGEAVGEVGAAADQAQAYADLVEDKTDVEYYYLVAEILIHKEEIGTMENYLRARYAELSKKDKDEFALDVAQMMDDYRLTELALSWLDLVKDRKHPDYKSRCWSSRACTTSMARASDCWRSSPTTNPTTSIAGSTWHRRRSRSSTTKSVLSRATTPLPSIRRTPRPSTSRVERWSPWSTTRRSWSSSKATTTCSRRRPMVSRP